MKHRLRWILIAGCSFLTGLVGLFLWNAAHVGNVLDRYQGVPVYDNGLLFFRSYGRHYGADSYYYGQKWQCVEYIKRFYRDALDHKMPEVMGHAKSFFDETVPDGGVNPQRDLVQYRSGSTEKPCPNDLIVFADTKYGHVGIVTDVTNDFVESSNKTSLAELSSVSHWWKAMVIILLQNPDSLRVG